MNDEVKAAAERVAANARRQSPACKHIMSAHRVCQWCKLTQEEIDAVTLADAYLAQHDPGAVTEEWLLTVRLERITEKRFHMPDSVGGGGELVDCSPYGWEWQIQDEQGPFTVTTIKTRGQLLSLLSALGINTKEKT